MPSRSLLCLVDTAVAALAHAHKRPARSFESGDDQDRAVRDSAPMSDQAPAWRTSRHHRIRPLSPADRLGRSIWTTVVCSMMPGGLGSARFDVGCEGGCRRSSYGSDAADDARASWPNDSSWMVAQRNAGQPSRDRASVVDSGGPQAALSTPVEPRALNALRDRGPQGISPAPESRRPCWRQVLSNPAGKAGRRTRPDSRACSISVLQWSPDARVLRSTSAPASLFTALREQLVLQLAARRTPVDVS